MGVLAFSTLACKTRSRFSLADSSFFCNFSSVCFLNSTRKINHANLHIHQSLFFYLQLVDL